MPCFKPLDAFISKHYHPDTGKRSILFGVPGNVMAFDSVKLPCGQCVGCRLERSRQWALRCMHESKLHDRNCFITLTYDEAHLPPDRGLHYRDFQLFMKRLRKRFGDNIRFYMCGEYGEKVGRPHFHACLFGHDFDDKKLWSTTPAKSKLYRSESLEELWPNGFSSVGDVTFESAAYVARYITKKITGEAAESHYKFFRSFNRGDIRSTPRIYKNVLKARHRCEMVN